MQMELARKGNKSSRFDFLDTRKNKLKSNRSGFEFSFAWLFALLVGAVILFLAIYFAIKLIGTGEYQISTATAKQLTILFEPMQIALESGKGNIAELKEETVIYNKCFSSGSFGLQRFSLSRKGFGNKWTKEGGDIPVTNKYIFSNASEQGKTVYFFSKPFMMPWKVSEVTFLSTSNYCFVNAPEEIKDDIPSSIQNIKFDNCSQEIKVCFGQGNCEIEVEGSCLGYNCESIYDSGFVSKNNEKMYYDSFDNQGVDRSLLYGAIFSSKEIYECNVKRLMLRIVQEALLYSEESGFLTGRCGSLPETGVLEVASAARNYKSSLDLSLIKLAALDAETENEAAECRLW
jgi:hypothetical protein